MTQERKVIKIETEVVAKKSPEFQEVKHKANASMTEAEVLEKYTIGRYDNDEGDGDEGDQESSNV